MGEIAALLAGFFLSSGNLMARQGMKKMDRTSGLLVTLLANNLVNLCAVAVLLAFCLLPGFSWLGVIYFVVAGALTSFVARFFLFAGIERIGASRAGLLKTSAPIFTVFFGATLLGERLSILEYAGSAVVLTGLYLLSASPEELGKAAAPPAGITAAGSEMKPWKMEAGLVYGLLSGFFLSVGQVFRKLGIMHLPSPVVGVAVGGLASLLGFVIFFGLKNGGRAITGPITQTMRLSPGCRGYLYCGVLTTLAQYLFFFSLLYTSLSITNILAATENLFNLLLIAVFFRGDELLTRRLVFLTLLVLSGVVLIML